MVTGRKHGFRRRLHRLLNPSGVKTISAAAHTLLHNGRVCVTSAWADVEWIFSHFSGKRGGRNEMINDPLAGVLWSF